MRSFLDCRSRRHEFVTTPDGVRLSVREWGDPAGRPILFIHGVVQSHLAFLRQFAAEELKGCRLVAYDCRGHGESGKPADPVFYQDHLRWAGEVQAVIDGMALDRPILVGWSMGGRIIGQYLTVYGDTHLSGINLVSARVVADVKYSGPTALALSAPRESGLAADIVATGAFVRGCFHRAPEPDDFAFMLGYNLLAWPGLQASMRIWPARAEETIAALRAVKVPALITHGALDAIVLPSVAEFAAEQIPGSQLSIYEDCGHSPFWEHAARFNAELAAFAQRAFASVS